MKRVFIVAVFLVCLCVPLFVKADMDAPSVKEYTASVSNPEGAITYSYEENEVVKKGVLAFGTTITVQYEEEVSDELYANVHTYEGGNYDSFLVKIEDITIIKDGEIKVDYDLKKDGIVLANEGVDVYTGPAYAYEKTGTILPKNAEVVLYGIKDASDAWMYVEYNGSKGFVCVLNGVIGLEKVERGVMTYDITRVYDKMSDVREDAYKEIIPRNVRIEDVWRVDPWSQSYYIEYNGIKGYVGYYDVAYDVFGSCRYNLNTISIYENVSLMGEPLYTGSVEEDDLIFVEYSIDRREPECGYLTYKGVSGWVKIGEETQRNGIYEHTSYCAYDFPAKVINEKGCNYYEIEYDDNGDISDMKYVGTVAYGEKVTVNTYPSNEKWQGKTYREITIRDLEYAVDERDIEIPEVLKNEVIKEKNIENSEKFLNQTGKTNNNTIETEEVESKEEDKISFTSRQILVMSVAVGIVFLLMFAVIIALANKKSGNTEKNDDSKK